MCVCVCVIKALAGRGRKWTGIGRLPLGATIEFFRLSLSDSRESKNYYSVCCGEVEGQT